MLESGRNSNSILSESQDYLSVRKVDEFDNECGILAENQLKEMPCSDCEFQASMRKQLALVGKGDRKQFIPKLPFGQSVKR